MTAAEEKEFKDAWGAYLKMTPEEKAAWSEAQGGEQELSGSLDDVESEG